MKYIALILLVYCSLWDSKAQNARSQVSSDWTTLVQKIEIKSDTSKNFIFKGYLKTDSVSKTDTISPGAILSFSQTDDDPYGNYKHTIKSPNATTEWTEHRINGTITKNTTHLIIGLFIRSDVTFYYDEFSLEIENEHGILEPFPLANSSFESLVTAEKVIGWQEGAFSDDGKSIKEFDISSSSLAYKGDRSLKIVGTNTGLISNKQSIEADEIYKPQLGILISMLDDLKERVRRKVYGMSDYEIDHLHDPEANRIGALVMHLAAAEVLYQVRTFENRAFNEEEEEKWNIALNLGDEARVLYKGKPIEYYLNEFDKVRNKTKELFETVDEAWLQEEIPAYGMNKYYGWFHVMEHQSSHLGQILFLSKRIPPEAKITSSQEIKN